MEHSLQKKVCHISISYLRSKSIKYWNQSIKTNRKQFSIEMLGNAEGEGSTVLNSELNSNLTNTASEQVTLQIIKFVCIKHKPYQTFVHILIFFFVISHKFWL